jgi:carbamoyl-phosphate synthase large subunit
MAIGRTFEEAIQKGIRMIGQGMHGFTGNRDLTFEDVEKELAEPTDMRILVIAEAFEKGFTIDRIWELTKIDRWFLGKLKNIFELKNLLESYHSLNELPDELLRKAKILGFSDFQIARHVLRPDARTIAAKMLEVRNSRKRRNILPVVKQIDTLAAEYPAQTNYLYLTYGGTEHDVTFADDDKSVIVLGGFVFGVEFAQILHSLGAQVTIVEPGPQILEDEDAELVKTFANQLIKDGITIITQAALKKITPKNGSVSLTYADSSGEKEITAEKAT